MRQKGSSSAIQKCIPNMRIATARGWNEKKIAHINTCWLAETIGLAQCTHTEGSNEKNRQRQRVKNNSIERLKNRYVLNKLKPKLFKMKRNEMHTRINRKPSRAQRRNNGVYVSACT